MSNVDMEDIMAEGIQGLVVAMDKFDHTRGIKLSTYAAWWIRQRIQRLMARCLQQSQFPTMFRKASERKVLSAPNLQVELGRMPTEEEVKTCLRD